MIKFTYSEWSLTITLDWYCLNNINTFNIITMPASAVKMKTVNWWTQLFIHCFYACCYIWFTQHHREAVFHCEDKGYVCNNQVIHYKLVTLPPLAEAHVLEIRLAFTRRMLLHLVLNNREEYKPFEHSDLATFLLQITKKTASPDSLTTRRYSDLVTYYYMPDNKLTMAVMSQNHQYNIYTTNQ